MVKSYPALTATHIDFITKQSAFYVATAPWAGAHVNLAPLPSPAQHFSVLNSTTVAYLDHGGAGCETIAHINENARATLMFCSHGAFPTTMRLFGSARVVEKWDRHFSELRAKMQTENGGEEMDVVGARAIIVLKLRSVQVSAGLSIPALAGNTAGDEDPVTVVGHVDAHDPDHEPDTSDLRSLDGLPGLQSARQAVDQNVAVEDTKAWLRKVRLQPDAIALGVGLGMVLMIFLSLIGFIHIEPSFLLRILEYQKRQMGHDEL